MFVRVPAHRTGCVPVKPGSDTLLTENVFAVKHYRVMVSVLADRTVTSTGLDLVLAGSFTIPRKTKFIINQSILSKTHLVDCISFMHASLKLLTDLTKIFPLTTM